MTACSCNREIVAESPCQTGANWFMGRSHAQAGANQPECGCHPAARWYCCQINPRQELLAINGLMAQGFPVHFPKYEPHPGAVLAPLFPGYLFVRFAAETGAWKPIWRTPGVRRLLSRDPEHPIPIPDAEIEMLFRAAQARGYVAGPPPFLKGDDVRILRGAFTGNNAIVESAEERVRVLLTIFGRTLSVDIAYGDIERVSEAL